MINNNGKVQKLGSRSRILLENMQILTDFLVCLLSIPQPKSQKTLKNFKQETTKLEKLLKFVNFEENNFALRYRSPTNVSLKPNF
jgi:hypothetical protein